MGLGALTEVSGDTLKADPCQEARAVTPAHSSGDSPMVNVTVDVSSPELPFCFIIFTELETGLYLFVPSSASTTPVLIAMNLA